MAAFVRWVEAINRRRSPGRQLSAAGLSGATVIELLIVAVIIAILAAVAYPSYEDYQRRDSRSVAQEFLVDLASRQQQYLREAHHYAVGAGALGALGLKVPSDVAQFYSVTVTPAAPTLPPSFTLVATPLPGSRQAADGTLTLDSSGARTRNGEAGW
jgi:type IV pilus assembly protein PilE